MKAVSSIGWTFWFVCVLWFLLQLLIYHMISMKNVSVSILTFISIYIIFIPVASYFSAVFYEGSKFSLHVSFKWHTYLLQHIHSFVIWNEACKLPVYYHVSTGLSYLLYYLSEIICYEACKLSLLLRIMLLSLRSLFFHWFSTLICNEGCKFSACWLHVFLELAGTPLWSICCHLYIRL